MSTTLRKRASGARSKAPWVVVHAFNDQRASQSLVERELNILENAARAFTSGDPVLRLHGRKRLAEAAELAAWAREQHALRPRKVPKAMPEDVATFFADREGRPVKQIEAEAFTVWGLKPAQLRRLRARAKAGK